MCWKLARVLPQHRVFELQHVDRARVDLAMDQPRQIAIAEFADRVRLDRAQRLLAAFHAHDIFRGRANPVQLRVGRALALVIQQDDQMQIAQPGQFAHRLIHEHAAAVHRRTNRIRRDEQDTPGAGGFAAQRQRTCRESGRPAAVGKLRGRRWRPARALERATRSAPRQAAGTLAAMPEKLERSGESPASQLSIAPAQVKKKCEPSQRQS